MTVQHSGSEGYGTRALWPVKHERDTPRNRQEHRDHRAWAGSESLTFHNSDMQERQCHLSVPTNDNHRRIAGYLARYLGIERCQVAVTLPLRPLDRPPGETIRRKAPERAGKSLKLGTQRRIGVYVPERLHGYARRRAANSRVGDAVPVLGDVVSSRAAMGSRTKAAQRVRRCCSAIEVAHVLPGSCPHR
jgi:hypothetical protein